MRAIVTLALMALISCLGSEDDDSGSSNAQGPGPVPPNSLYRPIVGTRKMRMIRVDYPNAPGGILSDIAALAEAAEIKATMETNANGRLTVAIDVTPLLRMPKPTTYYISGGNAAWARVRADADKMAFQAGYAEGAYDYDLIYSTKVWAPWAGHAVWGGRVAYMNWSAENPTPFLADHELGHNFGWGHANFWLVPDPNPISLAGKSINYGDPYDIMGGFALGHPPRRFHHFHPWRKLRADWLPEQSVLEIAANGTYSVQAIEIPVDYSAPSPVPSALRIRRDLECDLTLGSQDSGA